MTYALIAAVWLILDAVVVVVILRAPQDESYPD